MSIGGHVWTVLPHLRGRLFRPRLAGFEPWHTFVDDERTGAIELHGRHAVGTERAAVVLVHGLGGGLDSPYIERAAAAVAEAGLACLILAVRGAERAGEDLHHAGQTADIEAALRSPPLSSHEHLYLIGFSLGGHMALRLGLHPPPRLRAIAAVCPPLDLDKSSQAIDAAQAVVYRAHILRGLREIYREVARRRHVPTPLARIERVRTIREWDSLTVVPRYGFASVDDYYQRMSVAPVLSQLKVPALIVQSDRDPMVPAWTFDAALADAGPGVHVRRVRNGGHVGFPARLDLGMPGPRGLERQILSWLERA